MAKSNAAIERQMEAVSDWLETFEYEDPRCKLGLAVLRALTWARGRRVEEPLQDLKWRATSMATDAAIKGGLTK